MFWDKSKVLDLSLRRRGGTGGSTDGLLERRGITGCATPEDNPVSTCRVELAGRPRKSRFLMRVHPEQKVQPGKSLSTSSKAL